jgi:signal transduction histidine kinase
VVFGYIRKSLGNKIMAAVTVCILLVMGVEIVLRIYFGTRDRVELVETLNDDLVASTYSGIQYPMSVGDSEAVEKVLADMRLKMSGVDVFICDSHQQIIWSTHQDKIQTVVADSISSKPVLEALAITLSSGVAPGRSLEEEVAGERHLITMQPIFNQKDCFHCHGAAKEIIGGMVIRTNAEKSFKAVAAARDRTIFITFIGISAIIIFINLLIGKFVRRRVKHLVDTTRRFAEGDMDVSVEVKTSDEIGVLGNTFNYMVRRIASFSKELEHEVEKKTSLLNERNVLLDRLSRANNQLREFDQVKSKFLANMSHELRTPMNSIIGYTDLLVDEVDGPINEEQRNSLQRITTNARHLMKLINDILDLSRIEAGKVELEVTSFTLRELFESLLPIFQPLVARKGLTLDVDLAEDLPPVFGDIDKMKQVMVNLIGNAIKFTEQGGIVIRGRISARGIKAGEAPIFAEVCVVDTGIGIKEEDIDKVFNKFEQADLSTTRQQYEGTGLGLSIVKQLVAMHMGLIWVESEVGKGSKFCFTIPIREDILSSPARPVVELTMADAMADYFKMPVEAFLREPRYGGKKIRCWEYIHCGETGCPAYRAEESRCWLILGTHCEGLRIAAYPEKKDFCKGCEVIRKLVLETTPFQNDESGATPPERSSV